MNASALNTADLYDERGGELESVSVQFQSLGGHTHFSGPVRTIRCFEDNALVKTVLATPGHGSVLVVDGAGSLRTALMGDMIAASAVANGWAGVVINGCIRDVATLAGLAFGVQALAANPLRSAKRGTGVRDVQVAFAGLTCTPGQYLYADEDGIIVADRPLES